MGTNLWRKLTLEWPCALGDWLWRIFVIELADFLSRLTFKRSVLIIGLILFIIAAASTGVGALSDVFLVANEAMVYVDVATAIMLLVVRGHVRPTLRAVARQAAAAVQALSKIFARYRSEARQRRNANALQRERVPNNKQSDDHPAGFVRTGVTEAFA